MRVQNEIDIHNVRTSAEQVGRTSDKFVGVGPVGLGLDGILTWVPGLGELYTLGASAYLLTLGVKARVPGIVLWQMSALLLFDLSTEAVPVLGSAADMFFCGHLWASMLLRRAIGRTAYLSPADMQPGSSVVTDAIRSGKHIVSLSGK